MKCEIQPSSHLPCPALASLPSMAMHLPPVDNFLGKAHNVCLEHCCTPACSSAKSLLGLSRQWIDCLHTVMAGCALKLHIVFNDTQKGFNDFSIHQLQYNLSCWQSVAPTFTYFSTPFCLGFYIFGTCVSTGVSGGDASDLALAQSKTFLQKWQTLGRTR